MSILQIIQIKSISDCIKGEGKRTGKCETKIHQPLRSKYTLLKPEKINVILYINLSTFLIYINHLEPVMLKNKHCSVTILINK